MLVVSVTLLIWLLAVAIPALVVEVRLELDLRDRVRAAARFRDPARRGV
jgi:hypothetical protein